MQLKIAYGNNRFSKKWSNKEITFDELCERFKNTRRTTETVSEYQKLNKTQRDEIKDVGGFVLGHLREGRRKKGNVESRSGITLDVDYADLKFMEKVQNYKHVIYSTHKHTPENPRYRLAIPVLREISADEYSALSRLVAADIGIDYFDDSTYEPERLMYWPSTPSDGEYIFKIIDGEILNPDVYLSKLSDWQDCSLWPTSSRQSEVIERTIRKQQDPLTKDGIVGVFCRAYSIQDVIETFLSDVYTPCAIEGRYDYIPADSSSGVIIYEDKWAYSHHATDPASNKLLNAFDIVRIHKFGDEKSSFKAMAEFAVQDGKVKLLIAEERKNSSENDFNSDDWGKQLEYEPKSTILKNSLGNLLLILKNDENLQDIRYNCLTKQIYGGKLPWDRPHLAWRDIDTAQLVAYVDKIYGVFSARNYELALTKAADDRAYHPIKDYLDNSPKWDGIKRVDELLVKYFGAEDNDYTHMVMRKTLCAAVARIYNPGLKFDSMLVLNGHTDLGKSTFFSRLAGEWFSDSLNFTDMGKGKDAAEKIQGVWIVEIPELAGLSKMDVNNIKGFLSRQDDQYRPSYGRAVENHPRQCIIVGSTNAENAGFLRDTTGNRRFWVVRVHGCDSKGWNLPEADVPQIWAEAKHYWFGGEKLYLDGNIAKQAKVEQTAALETDEREGLVREYLDMLLPENWYDMDIYARRNYCQTDDDPTKVVGVTPRKFVSNMEIWCECFGNDRGKFEKQSDSYKIKLIMQKICGWTQNSRKQRVKGYGITNVWERLLPSN